MSYQNNLSVNQTYPNSLRYLMWALPLSFFTFQFILRLWPSLMMQQIMQQFTIDATSFGLLASAYYYGYAGMQIPIAILLERFGPRYVLSGCAIMCALATVLFATTNNWSMALLSRFLIGVGSAAGILATSKVLAQWFPKEQYGRMIAFTFSVGLLGAVFGGKPTGQLVNNWGGEQVALALAFVSMLIGVLAYLFLRSPKTVEGQRKTRESSFKLADLKRLISSPTFVLLAMANLLMVGALEGFADVWGVNYLMLAYTTTKVDAAELVSFIFVGMLFGGPILNQLSMKLGNTRVISLCGAGIAVGFSYLLLFHESYDVLPLGILFFGVGILCCYQVLMFSAASDLVPAQLLGVTIAFMNGINMLGGSFFHSLIGFFMDHFWTGGLNEGLRHYSLDSYTPALMLIPVCAVIGSLLVTIVGLRVKRV